MTGAVVMQVLVGILTASGGNHAGAADETINQECDFVSIRPECFENEVGTGAHFVVIVSGDVC